MPNIKDSIKFSVIIPCFNDREYVFDAINSVLCQNYKNFEVIIVDDGSCDGTYDALVSNYSNLEKIKILKKENGGVAKARNHGIKFANGDYLVFLDADDLLMPFYFDNARRHIERVIGNRNTPEIIVCGYQYFPSSESFTSNVLRKKYSYYPPLIFGKKLNRTILLFGNCFPISSCIVAVDLVRKLEGYDSELKSMEDWDFWIRAVNIGAKFSYLYSIPGSHTAIRIRSGLMSNSVQMLSFQKKMLSKHHANWVVDIQKKKISYKAIKLIRTFLYFICLRIFGKKINLNGF